MIFRFGLFEVDTETDQLLKSGRVVKLQQQPYKLLCVLLTRAGKVVTREDIRAALWPAETFVDYDQGVNFAMKQVREALGDDAERPLYVLTVPKRGYRFIAPVDAYERGAFPAQPDRPDTNLDLQKILWANIAELRLADAASTRRRAKTKAVLVWGGAALLLAAIGTIGVLWLR